MPIPFLRPRSAPFRRRLSLVGLLLLATAAALSAQPNTLLYRVEGPGIQPFHVFGTIHLACPEQVVLGPNLRKQLAASRLVVMELDMDDPALMPQMLQHARGPQPLNAVLSPEQYERLGRFFRDSLRQPIDPYVGFHPLLVASAMYPKVLGCTPGSYELSIIQAKPAGVEVRGLETVAEQMETVLTLPLAEQAEGLLRVVDSLPNVRAEWRRLVSAYAARDLGALMQALQASPQYDAHFEEVMLSARNRKWIPKMLALAADQPVFFAVGAGHLAGEQGVLALLRAAGYTVTPVAES